MTDYFAIFGERPRPWIDEAALKDRFLALSKTSHPDAQPATDQNTFPELNRAYQTLREPKERLAHLLELVTGDKPAHVQHVPEKVALLFPKVNEVCQGASRFLMEQGKETSPMMKALAFPQALAWTDQIQALQATLAAQKTSVDSALRDLDARWDPVDLSQRTILSDIYVHYSYLTRWQAQLQERLAQLAF